MVWEGGRVGSRSDWTEGSREAGRQSEREASRQGGREAGRNAIERKAYRYQEGHRQMGMNAHTDLYTPSHACVDKPCSCAHAHAHSR